MKRKYDKKIERLVTAYAPVGRQRRRNRVYAAVAATVAVPVLILIVLQAWQIGGKLLDARNSALDGQAEELQAIRDSLAGEIDAINAQLGEFERSRDLLREQSSMLDTEIEQSSKRRRQLDEQALEFETQQQRLAESIDEIDDRRISMQRDRAELERQDPLLERERVAMNEERRKLEQQRKRYAEEGALLEEEIEAINTQRTELAAQRVEVEKRRKELQALLEKSKQLRNTTTNAEPSENLNTQSAKGGDTLRDEPEPEVIAYSPNSTESIPIGLPIVKAIQLEKTRGGFSVGDDMVISVGITRSASVNGVEQFSNALHIADLVSGITPVEMEGITSTLVQNGSGNYVSPDVLAEISGSFSTIVQNSLDNQEITTQNVYDISVENVSSAIAGIEASRAIDNAIAITP